jgi:hypothetical protein
MKHVKLFDNFITNENYPEGAENDPNAPWNQEDYSFDVTEVIVEDDTNLSVSLSWDGGKRTDEFPTSVKIDWTMDDDLAAEIEEDENIDSVDYKNNEWFVLTNKGREIVFINFIKCVEDAVDKLL